MATIYVRATFLILSLGNRNIKAIFIFNKVGLNRIVDAGLLNMVKHYLALRIVRTTPYALGGV